MIEPPSGLQTLSYNLTYDDKSETLRKTQHLGWNFLSHLCSHRSVAQSTLAVCVVGGLLIVVIVALATFVLLRRQQITRKRTSRRLLQEKEVEAFSKLGISNPAHH